MLIFFFLSYQRVLGENTYDFVMIATRLIVTNTIGHKMYLNIRKIKVLRNVS